ncbi:MAG TPA: transposase [Actinoplanes sp.]|nr:transposase [Actinoplanes sp.]
MSIVGGLDIHRKQLTFDWVDEQNNKWERGRISPADREHLAGWLTRFDPATAGPVAFAMEGCTGWRYIAEEMSKAGVTAHLAEPAETSARRGPKRRAKTDKADARLLRELLAAGRLPECYIPPDSRSRRTPLTDRPPPASELAHIQTARQSDTAQTTSNNHETTRGHTPSCR